MSSPPDRRNLSFQQITAWPGEQDLRPSSGTNRREFLRSAAAASALMAFRPWKAMAGPFTRKDFEKLVPADKKLHPEWVASLTERGEPEVYHGADLKRIGMPIGGLCAGQVYLGGDGALWHWDIFNQRIGTGAEHYASPLDPQSPFDQGFALRIKTAAGEQIRAFKREQWRHISFNGEYPIARIDYEDPDCPVTARLEAYSPFTPMQVEDSSLPVTVMEFTVRNRGTARVEAALAGWLENAVCLHSAERRGGLRVNRVVRRKGLLLIEASAQAAPDVAPGTSRPDIVFDDFEREAYAPWTAGGTAFGTGPVALSRVPDYQGDLAGHGQRVVNTHAGAPGNTVEARDSAQGTLTSPAFTIERNYINFLIGGGAHRGRTCMNLVVGGKSVLSATGKNDNRMGPMSWDVRRWLGQSARLEIVDRESGGWGNIGIDDVVFSDTPRVASGPLAEEADFGTMALALVDSGRADAGSSSVEPGFPSAAFISRPGASRTVKDFSEKLAGAVCRKFKLRPGASARVRFLVSWHMPNLKMNRLPPGRAYANRFGSAAEVAAYVSANLERLGNQTRLWHDTWYDSTLPYWFLDRTFANTSILATSTCYQFASGRFYGWEGVGCCEGTCGHVWQYAHAVARLFPELERKTREQVDFGLAQQPDGAIHFRGEFNDFPAIDAQAGSILRAWREHQMSAGDAFLKRTWPRIRKATEWLLAKDANDDGLIESNQHNTLDTDWFGPVAWLSGLYLSALLAAQAMAIEVEDAEFAARCAAVFARGRKKMVAELFDGEYFINRPDPHHADAINSGTGCEIDQVFGQSWAWQVGLGRVFPRSETLSALGSLWRYNFTPDVGPYRKVYKPGRWYAMPGEAGLLMCTFPRSDWDYAQAKGKGPDWAAGYFNECMNGFEYQVAGHMIWEGMVTEGLAIARAIHDRYHPARRNPWNEVECGDHYARSMASYGVFLAACGFEYHGPKGHMGFAPRIHPEKFKAAFTSAEGWGSYAQQYEENKTVFRAEIALQHGTIRLRSLGFQMPASAPVRMLQISKGRSVVRGSHAVEGDRLTITFSDDLHLGPGESFFIHASCG